jgi:3-phenylpropionate/trans-cinnamate dioxygenase ferredoxin subunit
VTKTLACSLDELSTDKALRVVIDGVAIAVVKDSSGVVHAIGDTCSHGQISLADGFLEDDTLECWAHGSAFSLKTGMPQNLPAYEPVPVFEVIVEGTEIFIDPTRTKEITA